ncbi:MAG: archaeal proteasome endopeptidase complex subunit alpha, partial [Candidatus Micrarchaeota archaeon]
MYPVSPQAYDRAITVFSPDGRLFQVEYAKEAVRRGATAVGVVCANGVVLAAYKNIVSELLVSESMRKIFKIDDHMAATASGLVADARRLVDIARLEAQRHRMTYNEPMSVDAVARHLCDLMQIYTQYGGIRPFGVSLLIAGIDTEPRLYEAEPSGALTGYKADAIGAGKKEAEEFFEKEYKEGMSMDDGIGLALRALRKTVEAKPKPEAIDVSTI